MENVLSREETVALLQGIEDGSVETGTGSRAVAEPVPYDFAERNSIERGTLPGLERIHERFGRELALSLSALLRREIEIVALETRASKAADYLKTLQAPSSLNLFETRPLPGRALLAFDPTLVYLAVDAYFGGPGRAPATIAARPLTAGELRVVELLRERAFAELRKAWAPIKPIEIALAGNDSDPEFIDLGDPASALLVARFEVKFGDAIGALHLALPDTLIEPVREALEAGSRATVKPAEWSAALVRGLADAPLELRSALVKLNLTLRALGELKPGDVIPAELPEIITVVSGGTALFRARFGASRGRNALRITERIQPAKASRNPS